MQKMLFFFIFMITFLYSKSSNISAFLPKIDSFIISIGAEKVNSTIDIFNMKEKEGSNKSSTLGDMEGIDFNFGYKFNNKIYTSLTFNYKKLNYIGTQLINKQLDLYLRYQLYKKDNLAFSIDGGYTINRANDTLINSLEAINNILEDILPEKEIELKEIENQQLLIYHEDDKSVKTIPLKNKTFFKVKNTNDSSFYTRAILSLKKDKWLFNTYLGYKETMIHSEMDSSIFDEDDIDLKKELEKVNFIQERQDSMIFGGVGLNYHFHQWIGEINYQYNYIMRVAHLQNTKSNHIFNLNLTYMATKNIDYYIGAKIMLHQFNGEIPYLYGEYNKGSFHHKYGFANVGVVYKF